MKTTAKAFIVIMIFALGSIQAKAAGLFVEPLVSYEKGSSTIQYPTPFTNSTGSIDGWGVGARLGVHFADVLFLGADGRFMKPRFKDSTNNIDVDSTGYNYGAVLGIQMPVIGFRVWGTYVFGGQLDPDEGNNVDLLFKEANGYRVGAGFRITFISFNVEYQDLKYNKTELQKVGSFSVGAEDQINLEDKTWIFSVSFPLSL